MKKLVSILAFVAILSASDDMKALEKSCDGNKADDCVYLGFLAGARHDYKNANKLYAKACELGDAMGCQNLGSSYANAQGVQKDYEKAKELFLRACAMKDGRGGCYNLGVLYEKQNRNELAKKYFKKACDLGDKDGCAETEKFTRPHPLN